MITVDSRPTIGGCVVIRDGEKLDFCWVEAIKSLLPVCDEVVVCDGESADETRAILDRWAEADPKIKVCVWPWKHPKGDIEFFVNWINYAREHLTTDWHIQLDADEILADWSHSEVRAFCASPPTKSARVTRYNFWRDHMSLIPDGECLGKYVVRIAPTRVWLASDGPHERGAEASRMAVDTHIEIFHYGFLRRREAFFEKEKKLHGYFFNTYDPRLEAAEARDGNWMEAPELPAWCFNLERYNGQHPQVIRYWLAERGYATDHLGFAT